MPEVARFAAWFLLVVITVLSLVPAGWWPETSAPHNVEHLAIFCATGFAFSLAYGRRPFLVMVALAISPEQLSSPNCLPLTGMHVSAILSSTHCLCVQASHWRSSPLVRCCKAHDWNCGAIWSGAGRLWPTKAPCQSHNGFCIECFAKKWRDAEQQSRGSLHCRCRWRHRLHPFYTPPWPR